MDRPITPDPLAPRPSRGQRLLDAVPTRVLATLLLAGIRVASVVARTVDRVAGWHFSPATRPPSP